MARSQIPGSDTRAPPSCSPPALGPLGNVLCLLENRLVDTAGEMVGPTEREALKPMVTVYKIRQQWEFALRHRELEPGAL